MNYIVLDLEFNQYFDFKHKSRLNKIKDFSFEIIQIGAVKLDHNFNIIDKKNFYIKPMIYKKIHPYVEKITHITSNVLQDSPHFSEIYNDFVDFVSGNSNIFCVWGGADISILHNNVKYYNLDISKIPHKYINVQTLACIHLKQTSGIVIGLKNAIEQLNLNIDLPFHDALNDAIYTAKILQIVNFLINKNTIINSNIIPSKSKKMQTYDFNSTLLYKKIEKEFGRKLTQKEKFVIKDVYIMGKKGVFDIKN